MAGTEAVLYFFVVPRAGIDVIDHEADRRAGRTALEDTGEDAYAIGLLPLARVLRCAGTPRFEVGLDVRFVELESGRAAVDHGADCGTMAFAKCGDAERAADRVA